MRELAHAEQRAMCDPGVGDSFNDAPALLARGRPRIDAGPYVQQYQHMAKPAMKRVTVNLPDDLLRDAEQVTGRGITETLIEGLRLVARRRAYTKALELRGKLDLRIDMEVSRERARR